MTRMGKDVAALGVVVLGLLAFLAAYEDWNVWLVGGNMRWAAAVVLLLGAVACSLGTPAEESGQSMTPFAVLGSVALVLALIGIVFASWVAVALLVGTMAVMWAVAALRHVHSAAPIAH